MNANTTLRYCIYAGLFAVPFIFFLVPGSLLFPFISGKAFAFRIIVEIIFGLWLALILRDNEYRPRSSWILKAVSVFILVVLIADIFAIDPLKAFWSNYERMEGFVALIHLFAYFLVASSVLRTKEIWNRFFAVNVGASTIMAIYSFFQIAGKITINQGGVRVDGTFGNATYLGIYMIFNIAFAAILFLQARGQFQKWALGAVIIMDLVVLYYTATRGAILGILGGAFISFIYMAVKAEKGKRIRKIAAGFVALIILGSGVFWLMRNTSFVQQSLVLSRFANLSLSEIQTQGRYYVWPMAVKGFQEKPILGWGQEGFNYVFNKYYDARMYEQEPWFDRTHNIILDWLVNAGALGLLSYLAIFAALLYSIRKSSDSISKEERALLYGLIFAYFFHNLFVFDQIGSYILFFSVLAYIHALTGKIPTGRSINIYEKIRNSLGSPGMKPITESVILILVITSLYLVNYISWKENTSIIKVLRASSENTVAPIDTYTNPLNDYNMGFVEAIEHVSLAAINAFAKPEATQEFKQEAFTAVDSAFKRHLERAPYDVRNKILYSRFLASLGLYDQSIPQLEEAAKYSENKQFIHIELGNQLILSGKIAEGVEKFKFAYELEPSYEEARFIYGIGAIYNKDSKLAEELLKDIPEEKIIYDDRYIGALFAAGRYSEVIDALNKRIAGDPTNTQHRITLASVYLQIEMRQEAIAQIQKIIEINPSFKEQGDYYISEIRAGRNP